MPINIPLIKPFITDTVKQRVMDVLDSGYLTEGPITAEFEQSIANYCGVSHVVAVTSCTTGLELALRCLGIGPGDEVIVPDYTYPATASVVNIVGATAVIVDVNPETMLVNYDALEEAITDRTRAAIPVSLFGNPLDWERLYQIKSAHDIFLIEDAACSLGSSFNGRMTGNLADISVFSHHPRKFITTGEGGTICTNNTLWADWMRSYKHFGMGEANGREGINFERIGTNYKLSNVLAAIGLEQMKTVNSLLEKRRSLASHYIELLVDVPHAGLPQTTPGGKHSWQTFCIFVDNRDNLIAALRRHGIEAQIGTYSLHVHKAFSENPLCRIQTRMYGSKKAYSQCLALPLFHSMTELEQLEVIDKLKTLLQVGKV